VILILVYLLALLQDYKDDNHKPEMALALEDFEALCGFVSPAELKQVLQEQPEVKLCVGEEAAAAFMNAEGDDATKQVCRGRQHTVPTWS